MAIFFEPWFVLFKLGTTWMVKQLARLRLAVFNSILYWWCEKLKPNNEGSVVLNHLSATSLKDTVLAIIYNST